MGTARPRITNKSLKILKMQIYNREINNLCDGRPYLLFEFQENNCQRKRSEPRPTHATLNS